MDLRRIHQLIDAQIECCRQALSRHRAVDDSLTGRNSQALQAWSVQQQGCAAHLADLTRRLRRLLDGRSLSDVAADLPQVDRRSLLEKSRELARLSADWRLANARSFRFLQRTASASQAMLEHVFGLAGGYDSRGNMMNNYRSSY